MEETNTSQDQAEQANVDAENVIDTALNDAVTESIGGVSNVEKKEEVTTHSDENKAEESAASEAESSQYNPDNALLERAVKAGLSIDDVATVTSKETAERIIALAEKAREVPNNDFPNGKTNDGAGEPADDVSATIEAMEKDGGYDANLMKLLKGLVSENVKLKSAGASAEKTTFFDQQFGSLDEAVRSHVDAVAKAKLREKFDMLERGYGDKSGVKREDVFREAVTLALGDLTQKAAEERKAAALEQRKNLTLSRPGGESGHHRHNGPVTEADIANEIWDQINN